MAYSDFTLERARKDLGLTVVAADLFPGLAPLASPSWLGETLDRHRGVPLVSEKARGELIVMPVLVAARELAQQAVTIFSGQNLSVDAARGLVGECDFILARTPPVAMLSAPILTIVEAKKGDIEQGLGQCAAQMVGAQLFNRNEGQPEGPVYGCVTTGEDWQFLKLEGSQLTIDLQRYYIHDRDQILAILRRILLPDTPGAAS